MSTPTSPEPERLRQYTLSNEETETWQKKDDEGAEFREFTRGGLVAGEPKGTRVQLFDAWGALIWDYTVH